MEGKQEQLGPFALAPHLIASIAIPALGVQQQISIALRLARSNAESTLDRVLALVHDVISDLSSEQMLVDLDLESTEDKMELLRSEALEGLAEWHRRLKVADEVVRSAEAESSKIQQAKERMNSMRAAYLKELAHLKEQVHQKETAEANGSKFEFVDLTLFNPLDYTLDENGQSLQEKLDLLEKHFDARHQAQTAMHTEKVAHLTGKLDTVKLLLEKKDKLLRNFMQKHGYCTDGFSEESIAKAASLDHQRSGISQRSANSDGSGTPSKSHKRAESRKWTPRSLFNRSLTRAASKLLRQGSDHHVTNFEDAIMAAKRNSKQTSGRWFFAKSRSISPNMLTLDSKPDKWDASPKPASKLSQITNNIAGPLLRKVERAVTNPKAKTVLTCAGCHRDGCEAAGVNCNIPAGNHCIRVETCEGQDGISKGTCERSVQSDIGGKVMEKALAKYLDKNSEAKWFGLLRGVSGCSLKSEEEGRDVVQASNSVGVQTDCKASRSVGLQTDTAGNDSLHCKPEKHGTSGTSADQEKHATSGISARIAPPPCLDSVDIFDSHTTAPPFGSSHETVDSSSGVANILQRHGVCTDAPDSISRTLSSPAQPAAQRRWSDSAVSPSPNGAMRKRPSVSSGSQKSNKPTGRLKSMSSLSPSPRAPPLVISSPLPAETPPLTPLTPIGAFNKAKSTPSQRRRN